jgi:hypothetical protein
MRAAMNSGLREIAKRDLRFGRYDVEHVQTLERFRIERGEVVHALYTPAVAFYVDGEEVVFLEPV